MLTKQRFLTAINGGKPDRLPVTTHHLMPYFLDKYTGGMTNDEFFQEFGLDAINWIYEIKPADNKSFRYETNDPVAAKVIVSNQWQLTTEPISRKDVISNRYTFHTPSGELSTIIERNEHTFWSTEHLVKKKSDIEIIAKHAPSLICDMQNVNSAAEKYGENALIRSFVNGFDLFGQPGVWQDAACLYGVEPLIMATYDDPSWVKQFLEILYRRKEAFVKSLKGVKYDILELGGGDASSTVISPKLFEEFVAPYDTKLIECAHEMGQKIVYHICGGIMPVLELLKSMNPDAIETFSPSDMGGDADLAKAREVLGPDKCMIGGFDQFHFFKDCTPEKTRAEVRRCFNEAGKNGAFILAPSDHFFDADLELIRAFADEARSCVY